MDGVKVRGVRTLMYLEISDIGSCVKGLSLMLGER